MIIASERGYEQCVRTFIRHSVQPDIHDSNGFTSLHVAARRGHSNIVQVLIDGRCNIDKVTYRVRATALHWAATNGHEDCVDVLLAAGAKVDPQTTHGRTPLMLAARMGHIDIMQSLLDAGSDVRKRDFDRTTALHLAAEEGHRDCVAVLLKAGAHINYKTKSQETPLLMALKAGRYEVVSHLLKCPDIEPTPQSHGLSALHWTSQAGHTDCLQCVLPYYTDTNIQTTDSYLGPHFAINLGVTPLMVACGWGNNECAQLLLSHGAKTETSDIEGMTALFHAVRRDHGDCVATLLANGADPDRGQASDVFDDPELFDDQDELAQHQLFVLDSDSTDPYSTFTMTPLFMAIDRNSIGCFVALLQGGCSMREVYIDNHNLLLGPLEFALHKSRINMCYMFLNLGRPFNLLMSPVLQQSMATLLEHDEHSFSQLMGYLGTPPRLTHQCRWFIRKCLNTELSAITHLPLPEAMKQFLCLNDIKDLMD